MFYQIEMCLKAFLQAVFCLADILFSTFTAGYAVDEVVTGTVRLFTGGVCTASGMRTYFARDVEASTVPALFVLTPTFVVHVVPVNTS